jgi:transposase
MLADQLDYVVGVDPHRDAHSIGIVDVRTGAVVFEAAVRADTAGYEEALRLAEQHAPIRRAFAVEGTASFGAGLTRFLVERGEQVFEVGRLRRERRSGGKTDALDAVRAARSVLGQKRPALPRSNGEREALRALMAAREGAVTARTAALCQLRGLLVTTPEPLRSELRPLTRARLLARLLATRPDRRHDPELRGTQHALKALARRIQQLTAEERELAREIEQVTRSLAPQLLDQPASGRCSRRRSCSPGHTTDASSAKPPSPASPAPPRSPPHPAKRSATASTAAATASSTAPCTRSSSPAGAHTRRRSPTSTDAPKKARPDAK